MPPRNDHRPGIALDFVAFALGLGMAWALEWRARDLVWGLWLSSLVIGYASLLITIASARVTTGTPAAASAAGKVFLVAFFTVHFGGFHFVHSVFLNLFFPVHAADAHGASGVLGGGFGGGFGPRFGAGVGDGLPGLDGYAEVLRRYWPWLVVTALAERRALWPRRTVRASDPSDPNDANVRAEESRLMFQPYANVVRMHLLIFFFAGAAFVGLDNFAVYVVVSAVYFLPWRVLLGTAPR